jgi:hypothetical protein
MTKVPRVRKFIAHEPGFSIIDVMNKLFPQWFSGPSWDGWRAILKAAFALPRSRSSSRSPVIAIRRSIGSKRSRR